MAMPTRTEILSTDAATLRENPDYLRAEVESYAWEIFKHCAHSIDPDTAWRKAEAWLQFKLSKGSPAKAPA
jgi:hypothetical protein